MVNSYEYLFFFFRILTIILSLSEEMYGGVKPGAIAWAATNRIRGPADDHMRPIRGKSTDRNIRKHFNGQINHTRVSESSRRHTNTGRHQDVELFRISQRDMQLHTSIRRFS
jgi:hypothetical protein